ncbi:MAG: glycerol-3-phosphate dehydrogenase/oxidase [Actinomycetota bacterium]|nr:glycerol-3-phosphate dehydrogenase/oxidase [Actinomycetota bacterium]
MIRSQAGAPRTSFERDNALARMAEEKFDVLVIGGGITGAGTALDASARGLRTALVERRDFASGTSSRSSKLIHGGLRYLQQREFRLVYEGLAERQRLLENAPHLVTPLPFLIPLFGTKGALKGGLARLYSVALWQYDLTGGLRIGKRHRRISREEAQRYLPTLDVERLVAGFLYWDAQTDDARLALTVLRTAVVNYGAVAANYAPVANLLTTGGRVSGARLDDGTEIRAEVVVNATGVWSDQVRGMDEGVSAHGSLRPAKGIHVTFPPGRLPMTAAAVLPVPGDRRSVFLVPWGEFTYAGTTDTDYSGPLDDPQCAPEDVEYLLAAVNAAITSPLTKEDIVASWAGLRPLVRSAKNERTADLSRRHRVTRSTGGVVTVTGGKFTTYRRMASDVADQVVEYLGRGTRHSPTKRLRLLGAEGSDSLRRPGAAERLGIDDQILAHLAGRYGTEARTVIAMTEADPQLAGPLVPGLPYLRAEAVYAARYEMAWTLEDVLARRTRALLLARDASAAAAAAVARLIAPELGWSVARTEQEAADYCQSVGRAREAAGLTETVPLVLHGAR